VNGIGSCRTLIPSSTSEVHRGERPQDLERVERRPAAAQRISDPDAGKAAGFDLPGEVCDVIHQAGSTWR
jgi:hypothetical protein